MFFLVLCFGQEIGERRGNRYVPMLKGELFSTCLLHIPHGGYLRFYRFDPLLGGGPIKLPEPEPGLT